MGATRLPTVALKRHSDQVFAISQVNNAGVRSAQNIPVNSLAVPAAQVAGWSLGFRLEDLPNDSEIASMWQYYKLNAVAVTFSIKGMDAEVQSLGGYGLPIMHYFISNNQDENNMPVTLQALRERSGAKKFYFGNKGIRRKTIVLKPRLQSTVEDINQNAVAGVARRMYIPTDNRTPVHTGLCVYFDTTSAASAATSTVFDIECTYYFTLKGTK